ncbi:PqqD family protein [Egibacter rhizosphaerae]|nr:PqqD family protein [Egibacter rhizosphaerae]
MAMKLRDSGLSWQVVDDDVVVLDLDGSVYFRVNGTGRVLWERLQQPATVDELVAELTGNYDVDEAQARADVEAFLGDLRTRDLIEDA